MNSRQSATRLGRRRALALAAAGFAPFALAACGGSSNKTNNAPATAASAAPSSAPGSPAPATTGSGSPVAAGSPAARASAAPVVKAQKGGTLRLGQVTDLTLNTGFPYALQPQTALLAYPCIEPPLRYRDSLTPELVLAEKYDLTADRTGATLALRQGATFGDGSPVTADDMIFGINLLQNPAKYNINAAFQLTPFAKMITAMQKLDDRTVQFTFDQPRVNITDFFAQLAITKQATYDKLKAGQDVEGSGPYAFKSWTPNQSYQMVANPKWHAPAGEGGPFLDGISVRLFSDINALGIAFDAGEVDAIIGATGTLATPYKAKNQTYLAPQAGLVYCGMVVTNPLLKDARVRQAILYAVDRNRMVNEIGGGFGPVTIQPWPSTSPAYDPALNGPYYDPQKAKQLLAAAGFQQDRNLQLEYTSGGDDAVPQALKDNLAAVGIKVDLVPTEGNAASQKFRQRGYKDLFLASHSFSNLTPLTCFQQTYPYQLPDAAGNGGNISYYASDTYKDIVAQLTKLDPLSAEAKAQYQRFNTLWVDDPWMVALQANVRIDVVSPKVANMGTTYLITFAQSPNFGLIGFKA